MFPVLTCLSCKAKEGTVQTGGQHHAASLMGKLIHLVSTAPGCPWAPAGI